MEAIIFNGAGATTIVSGIVVVWAGLPLSLTEAAKVAVPLAVGLPEIAPVDGARVSPEGRLPETIVQA